MVTVSNEYPPRKDTIMKLLYILSAILALTLAKDEREAKGIKYVEAPKKDLTSAGSKYIAPSPRQLYWPQQTNNWVQPTNPPIQYDWQSTTTTPSVPVIKNDVTYGENGDYKYEYEIGDGTHVGEQGYFTNPEKTEDSLVKKGWYSFRGADGVVYTVNYVADSTGYHAYGSHLPSADPAPTKPPQTQADYPAEQTTKRPTYYPSYPTTAYPTQTYKPIQQTYKPPQQTYKPPQQTYNPPQQNYNPPQQTYNDYPSKPSYNPPKPSYNPPQQSYNPPQQSYNPPQQNYKPSQPSYNPPQQSYNPPQQSYNPPQQSYNPPQQSYNPPQQSYNPPQQSYNPPQQSYNPPQQSYKPTSPTYPQTYYPTQSTYNPPQQNYNQPQQQTYYSKYKV